MKTPGYEQACIKDLNILAEISEEMSEIHHESKRVSILIRHAFDALSSSRSRRLEPSAPTPMANSGGTRSPAHRSGVSFSATPYNTAAVEPSQPRFQAPQSGQDIAIDNFGRTFDFGGPNGDVGPMTSSSNWVSKRFALAPGDGDIFSDFLFLPDEQELPNLDVDDLFCL